MPGIALGTSIIDHLAARLLPCAACGAAASASVTRLAGGQWRVSCEACGALGPCAEDVASAAERWNVRTRATRERRRRHGSVAP